MEVALTRYDDLPAGGWYSGESHLHLQRDEVADREVWQQVAAEDLHIAHLLEMGNIMGTYFKQPAWGKAGRYERDGVALVSGQEDPRTVARGHTIHWNVERHTHFERDAFFQYHHVFERTRRGGAVTGYAHHGELFNGRRGLAIDVPFGLVDFIEVLQGGRIATETWYRLPEPRFPDPAGGRRRLALLRSDPPWSGAYLRQRRGPVHRGRVAGRVPPRPRLRDQRPVSRAARQRAADGRGGARGQGRHDSKSKRRPG